MASNPAKCPVCNKTFFNNSTKTRHVRTIHKEQQQPLPSKTRNHLFCPICPQEEPASFTSYNLLTNHFTGSHNISIEKSELNFATTEEFESWMTLKKIHAKYVFQRSNRTENSTYKYYYCNRSDSRGFESKSAKNLSKAGGTIRINGVCPSRVVANFADGKVTVVFVETHVGHGRELRAEHLTRKEQDEIVMKLASGVSNSRILKDARTVQSEPMERVNVINRDDLKYLKKKFNIEKRRKLCIEEPSQNQLKLNEAVTEFIEEKCNETAQLDIETRMKMRLEEISTRCREMDADAFFKCTAKFLEETKKYVRNEAVTGRKRKIDKQSY